MSNSKIVTRLQVAHKHLMAAKDMLQARLDHAEARRTGLEDQLTEIAEQDEEEFSREKMDRIDELAGRAAEITEELRARIESVDTAIDALTEELAETQKKEKEHREKFAPKVTKFMIRKRNRPTDTAPYYGNSCARANVKPGLYYDTKEAAQADADKLNAVNSKGFDVVEVLRPATTTV